MADIISNGMDLLRDNPDEFRKRRDVAFRKILNIMKNPPKSVRIDCSIGLDETLAPAYHICREMFGILLEDEADHDAFITYLVVQGLHEELKKFQGVRDQIYAIGGGIQSMADDFGISLSEVEKRMAAAETNVSSSEERKIEDLWKDGYITTVCPKCKKRAVWHPVNFDAICLSGCGSLGKFERRPGPENDQSRTPD